MKKSIFILLLFVVIGCMPSLTENQKSFSNLQRYLKQQKLEQQIPKKTQQFVVVPSVGCRFCINKTLDFFTQKEQWKHTVFVTNVATKYCNNNNFICDADKNMLNKINFQNNMQPIVFQKLENDEIAIFYVNTNNIEDSYLKINQFDDK